MTLARRVTVSVLTYNRAASLARTLEHLLQGAEDAPIVVVDNGSADGSSEMVRDRFHEALLVANPSNRGFARAVNQGIAASKRPVISCAAA